MVERQRHWADVWTKKRAEEVSWFQPEASTSLALVDACNLQSSTPIVDVGAGASTFVDGLLARGMQDVTLLDLSEQALAQVRARIGAAAEGRVHYVATDITTWTPQRTYGLWHDRAAFHFLVDAEDRAAYVRALAAALAPGSHAIVATFAEDGPEKCSGLPVHRWSQEDLAKELAPVLRFVESRRQRHVTPWGAEQSFVFCRFVRA